MMKTLAMGAMLAACTLVIVSGCSFPRSVWPQKDISLLELGDPAQKSRILIASRSSEFKDAVVKRLKDYYTGKPVYIRIVGIDSLKAEDARAYSGIVLMNACMAWGIDPAVQTYLEANPYYYRFIILTTSGDGDWEPKITHDEVDTISSASILSHVDELSQKIADKIDAFLKEDAGASGGR